MTVSLRPGSVSTLMEKEEKQNRNSGAVLPGPRSSFLSGAHGFTLTHTHTLDTRAREGSLYYGPQPDRLPEAPVREGGEGPTEWLQ